MLIQAQAVSVYAVPQDDGHYHLSLNLPPHTLQLLSFKSTALLQSHMRNPIHTSDY